MESNFTQRTVGEIAAEYPNAIRLFERLGIDYCCGGGRALPDACATSGITVETFIEELNKVAGTPEEAAIDWSALTLSAISQHLIERYHIYTREELVTLRALSTKVLGVHGGRHEELAFVDRLIRALEDDMLPHLMKEEIVLFPYCDQLENDEEPPSSCFGSVENPIRAMMMEHDAVGDLLRQLRATTSGYEAPFDACFSYRELYRRLADFEAATHRHIHIENNVFFPRAVELEARTLAAATR